jgi:NADPH:quinone reductase
MLAAIYDRTGPAHDVLRVAEVDTPAPGPGEVLVRLSVSGVNPTDFKSRSSGHVGFPFQVPNQDGAGVIEAVGEGVDRSRVGQRVWVWFAAWRRQWGTAAQYTVLPERQAVALPAGASDDLGASLGIPALTAHRCLFADGPIDNRTVLVAGGAGAVGHAAIELARRAGARVIATTSTAEKARLAREAGAHETVDYRAHDAAERLHAAAPDGIDRIVELSLGRNLELDLAAANPNMVVASYANEAGGDVPVPVRRLMGSNAILRFVLVYTMGDDAIREAVEHVASAVADGALSTLPLHRYDLDHTADAHDAVEAGAVGKVLIELP